MLDFIACKPRGTLASVLPFSSSPFLPAWSPVLKLPPGCNSSSFYLKETRGALLIFLSLAQDAAQDAAQDVALDAAQDAWNRLLSPPRCLKEYFPCALLSSALHALGTSLYSRY